ncbi:MAG TPA: OmpA family protein, partial [Candidatus Cloacimonadota bacterium]|nr:OmpA family protein [Candidatus Cloacimonadota bacterium]
DGDGLNDGAEVLNHKSDPLKMDTDADGLNDFDEAVQYKTDPLKGDTDGDTLSDYAEVMQHKTNPLVMDTDKGTVDDGTEVAENKDPLDPKDDVLDLRVGSTFSLEGIFFETAKSNILPESIPKLEQAYAALTANPDVKILIVGHTDSDGSEASNMTLSKNRADAVKKWLVDKGIATDRIRTDGKGESQPKATNDTAEGKALNRRIEFVVE